jgi:rSAM/selenodomain-associated transferase 1
MNGRDALIIFAKAPVAGRVKTRLGTTIGMERAAQVYRQLAERTFEIGKEILSLGGRAAVVHDPDSPVDAIRRWVGPDFELESQVGNTLGDRMRNAFESRFKAGAQRVAIVGTDVQGLALSHIRMAFDELPTHDVVIGPTFDGGYYLLGMKTVVADVFAEIPWSTAEVYRTTLKRCRGAGRTVAVLPPLHDIDTETDFTLHFRGNSPAPP